MRTPRLGGKLPAALTSTGWVGGAVRWRGAARDGDVPTPSPDRSIHQLPNMASMIATRLEPCYCESSYMASVISTRLDLVTVNLVTLASIILGTR
jgi:hypothetical protein